MSNTMRRGPAPALQLTGVLLQMLGCWVMLRLALTGLAAPLTPRLGLPPHAGFDLLLGALLCVPGTLLLAAGLEMRALAKGRTGAWALAALGGPVGWILALALVRAGNRPAGSTVDPVPAHRRSMDRIAAALLCALAAGVVVAGACAWIRRNRFPPDAQPREIPRREQRVLQHMRHIVRAQNTFKKTDWDGDGSTSFARFPVHLWQSVRINDGTAVHVGLVPRRLAFAMTRKLAFDGYLFANLYTRELPSEQDAPPEPAFQPLDYRTEWACVAVPRIHARSGLLVFLAANGTLYARLYRQGGIPFAVPRDPAAQGWTQLNSRHDLRTLQDTPAYTSEFQNALGVE